MNNRPASTSLNPMYFQPFQLHANDAALLNRIVGRNWSEVYDQHGYPDLCAADQMADLLAQDSFDVYTGLKILRGHGFAIRTKDGKVASANEHTKVQYVNEPGQLVMWQVE